MKKINKVAPIILLSSVILGMSSITVNADPVGNAKSKATVDFSTPNVPLGFAGAGATDISFGEVKISGNTADYNAIYTGSTFHSKITDDEKYASPNVTIRDDRGTMMGYSVLVQMTKPLTDKANPSAVLQNASIKLTTTSADTDLTVDSRIKPSSYGSVTVSAAEPIQKVFGADKNEGAGTWTFFFGDLVTGTTPPDSTVKNDKVVLTVPGGNKIAKNSSYEGELTWTLEDTPDIKYK